MGAYHRMPESPRLPRTAWIAIAGIWTAATAAAFLLLPQHIPFEVRIPFLLAACLELFFFVPLGWKSLRQQLTERYSVRQLATAMAVSGMLPFLVYALGTGTVSLGATAGIAACALAVSFWYAVLPTGKLRDAGFLVLVAVAMLAGVFRDLIPDAAPKLQAEFLGRVMWIRLGIMAALLIRRMPGTGFGWWPTAREWKLGIAGFVALFPVLFAMGWALTFFGLREIHRPWPQVAGIALGTFFGIFWVVALSEEFFLRGLLQQWLGTWMRSMGKGLLVTSLISGALHLPFRDFPNWKFALLATVAHAGYGWIFLRGGGIRAAMVTHALVVTVWRVWLV